MPRFISLLTVAIDRRTKANCTPFLLLHDEDDRESIDDNFFAWTVNEDDLSS